MNGHGVVEALCWERHLRDNSTGSDGLRDEPDVALCRSDGSASDRPGPAPGYLPVVLTVEIVIDGADSAAEEDVPDEEDGAGREDEGWGGDRFHHGRSVSNAGQVRKVEAIQATRLLNSRELGVGDPRGWEDGEKSFLRRTPWWKLVNPMLWDGM